MNKIKTHIFKLKYLLFIFILFSCSNENLTDQLGGESIDSPENDSIELPQRIEMGSAKAEEVPHIVEVLENITGKSTRASKSLSYKKAVIDMNIIKWIKESTTGNKNYTFPIFVDGASDDEFYNLIVPVDENGNVLSPKIRRYVVAPHALEAYRGSGYDFATFQGKYYTYSFDRFFNAINFKSGKLAMGMPDCNEDGSAIGSTSSSPIENPDLIQTDWHQLWGPSTDIPTGSISFSSLWESYTAYQAGAYQNTGSSSQYEETVSTSAQGIVWLGNNNPTAPTVTHHLYSATTFNITANHAPDGNAFSLGPDICTTRINIVIKWSDGTTTTFEYYTNCEATAPISKSSVSSLGKGDCTDEPMEVITINLMALVNVRNKLCLDEASEGYKHLVSAEGQDHLVQLSNFLNSEGVTGCADTSSARKFALEAVAAWPKGAEVDFELKNINNLDNPCARKLFDELESGIFEDDLLKPELTIPNTSVNLNLSQSILRMFNESKYINYYISNADIGTANAITNGTKTELNNSYLTTATELSIVRTMIHELIHAYLNARYGAPLSFNKGLDFKLKMEEFAKDNGITNLGGNQFHHEFMGGYVRGMAYSLYEWDKEYGSGGHLGWEYYYKMASAGLNYEDSNGNRVLTDSFKALFPTASERNAVLQIHINEQTGNSDSYGSKCN